MVTSKTRREYVRIARDLKRGASCETCGSRFELTVQHGQHNRPRSEVRSDIEWLKRCRILCATCHFIEDHDKMFYCMPKATLRRYNESCDHEYRRYLKLMELRDPASSQSAPHECYATGEHR